MWRKLNLKGWRFISNIESNRAGRIWVVYNPKRVSIVVISSNVQFLHCKVKLEDKEFLWSVCYGLYDRFQGWIYGGV